MVWTPQIVPLLPEKCEALSAHTVQNWCNQFPDILGNFFNRQGGIHYLNWTADTNYHTSGKFHDLLLNTNILQQSHFIQNIIRELTFHNSLSSADNFSIISLTFAWKVPESKHSSPNPLLFSASSDESLKCITQSGLNSPISASFAHSIVMLALP